MSAAFDALLREVRAVHGAHPDTRAFCPFPDDLTPQPMTPVHRPCADFMAREGPMAAGAYAALYRAMRAAGPHALWRETYAGTGIGRHFMDRCGCYGIIARGGAWASARMSAWLVYMPAGLWYPWHRHPAEELYLVVAGEAEFLREGMATETLGPGGSVFHGGDQPHAMRTRDRPVMAYVTWRNNLGVPPVLSESDISDGND